MSREFGIPVVVFFVCEPDRDIPFQSIRSQYFKHRFIFLSPDEVLDVKRDGIDCKDVA